MCVCVYIYIYIYIGRSRLTVTEVALMMNAGFEPSRVLSLVQCVINSAIPALIETVKSCKDQIQSNILTEFRIFP